MKALMLQNLGVMNYDMFLQGNSTLEASMKVEKDSTKLTSGMNEEDSSLLMMAKKYFAESVEVFLEVLKRSSNEDISTWREFINSYQMLSGVRNLLLLLLFLLLFVSFVDWFGLYIFVLVYIVLYCFAVYSSVI